MTKKRVEILDQNAGKQLTTSRPGKVQYFNNLDQGIIQITEDKAKITLSKYKESLEKSRNWITPATMILTLGLPIIAGGEFKKKFGILPATWDALFLIGLFLSFLWFVWTLVEIVKYNGRGNIDKLMEELKGNPSLPESKNDVSFSMGWVFDMVLKKLQNKIIDIMNLTIKQPALQQ